MKKKFWNRDRLLYVAVLILSLLFLYLGNQVATRDNAYFQGTRADTYYLSLIHI